MYDERKITFAGKKYDTISSGVPDSRGIVHFRLVVSCYTARIILL